ncbi:alpha/beta fold hydrolase [Fischerella sp. PCC 9605]|uniref:alpha/beta fold hydrolase n=1 Tax=Fischerella sp. PCC 9605 TaxID=1173024 RepID=UPI0009E5F9E2|nr:alpha/beta fold hydrolase [Fischerella sp. PCC 9605]
MFISRRQILAAIAAISSAMVLGKTKLAASQNKRATFVLVHGAWHGGWCWKKVKHLLQAVGHNVYTPSLMGMGEHVNMLSPQIDLNTHIQNIVALLEYEDLRDVILIGHSYAGMLITGVAEKVRPRLAQLVYLDAFLPENGKSLMEYWNNPNVDVLVQTQGDGWRVPWTDELFTLEDFGVVDPVDLAWMTPRMGDHPYKTFTQAVQFSQKSVTSLQRTYIQTSEIPFLIEAGQRAKKQGFRYYELLSAQHNAMVTQPQELTEILLNLI